jgi:hypothetical protein
MNGSIAAIVTQGLGAWGSPGLVITFGFGSGTTPAAESGAPEECFTGQARGSVFTSSRRDSVFGSRARSGLWSAEFRGNVFSSPQRGQIFSADDR